MRGYKMDIIRNNPNIENTPKEKKGWCTFQNHDHCIIINESTVLKCWNTLKKKYSSFRNDWWRKIFMLSITSYIK